jgi:hypothetical protein
VAGSIAESDRPAPVLDSFPVPWHCPACSSIIKHSELDPRPHGGQRYRCHICRLSLDFDEATEKLVVAPFEADHQTEPPAGRSRRLPTPVTGRPRPRHK